MPEPGIVVCTPVRTPDGRFGGALRDLPAPELGRRAVGAALARSGLAADKIDAAIMGDVIQAGARMNPARQAALNGGRPEAAPAMTVNRVCGSGAQAIASAAMEIALGHADCVMAGGMESMEQAPTSSKRRAGAIAWAPAGSTTPRSATASSTPSRASMPAGTPRTW